MLRYVSSSDIPMEEQKPYSLFETDINGCRFRMEFTPIGNFKMCYSDESHSSFEMKLPPVPEHLYLVMLFFFKEICNKHNTESALQLFWDLENEKYFLHLPKQRVSEVSVSFERDYILESQNWLVADIHSHGHISAFFSSTDNADEKGTRLFGVFGNLKNQPKFLLRAGSGGEFTCLNKEILFDGEDEVSCSEISNVVSELLIEAQDKIYFY